MGMRVPSVRPARFPYSGAARQPGFPQLIPSLWIISGAEGIAILPLVSEANRTIPLVGQPSREDLRKAADLRLAIRRFHAATEVVMRECGLTYRQYLLLLVVQSAPRGKRLTISDLSSALTLAPSSMTELLDRGEQAGLLQRISADHDARVFYVRATGEGRRRMAKAFRALARERGVLAGIAVNVLQEPDRPRVAQASDGAQ
jgi:DNA-binding MarR family transcriptional regulator